MSATRKSASGQPWRRYRPSRKDPDGLHLIRLKHGSIFLGEFYCDEFVLAGDTYNSTPGLKPWITHIAKVSPP